MIIWRKNGEYISTELIPDLFSSKPVAYGLINKYCSYKTPDMVDDVLLVFLLATADNAPDDSKIDNDTHRVSVHLVMAR